MRWRVKGALRRPYALREHEHLRHCSAGVEVKGRAIKHHDCDGGGWRDTAVVVDVLVVVGTSGGHQETEVEVLVPELIFLFGVSVSNKL